MGNEPPEIKYYRTATDFFSSTPVTNNRHTFKVPRNNLRTKKRGRDERAITRTLK
jgi:hypothetical protein